MGLQFENIIKKLLQMIKYNKSLIDNNNNN